MKSDINKLERSVRPNLKRFAPSKPVSSLPQSHFVHVEDPRGSSSGGGGGGVASPLAELAREYHPAEVYTSPDGLFQFSVKRIKTLRFQDAAQSEVMFHLNLSQRGDQLTAE